MKLLYIHKINQGYWHFEISTAWVSLACVFYRNRHFRVFVNIFTAVQESTHTVVAILELLLPLRPMLLWVGNGLNLKT